MPASSRIRPLSSILCALQSRPHKRRGSAPANEVAITTSEPTHSEAATQPTAATVVDPAASLDSCLHAAPEVMPAATSVGTPDMDEMQTFARANGPEPASNGVPVSGGRGTNRADTPQVFSSRQAVVDGARLPVPATKPTRFGSVNHHQVARSHSGSGMNPSPPQHHGVSPPMRRARTNSNDRVGGAATLWAPSILSDSEFNSPTSDLNNRHPPITEEIHSNMGPPPTWNPHQSSQFSEFIIGNDGMMKVKPIPNDQRQNPYQQQYQQTQQTSQPQHLLHHVNNHVPENPFEAPSTEPKPRATQQQQQQQQQRDSLARSSYGANHTANHLADEDEMVGAVPSSFAKPRRVPDRTRYEPLGRSSPMFSDEDDDDDFERIEGGGSQVTPRAKKPVKKLQESSMPPYRSGVVEDRGRKRRRQSCDYDDNALSSMKFTDLQKEPFDYDPTAEATPPSARANGGDDLVSKLEYYKTKESGDQATLFTQMSVTDWDRSGDWFLEQFGLLIQRMKESRQQRRAVVEKYEQEISAREEAVRHKTDSVNKKLTKMKQNGLKVVTDGDD